MPLRPERYRGARAQSISDTGTRLAYEELSQKIEQLARDANTDIDTFPSGAIVFWLGTAAAIPRGWEEATELQGRFPRGMASGGTPGVTGGAVDHTHNLGTPDSAVTINNGTGVSVTLPHANHAHGVSVTQHLPPYIDGIWIRKTA